MKIALFLMLILTFNVAFAEVFEENFATELDQNRWIISSWTAPRNGLTHRAIFTKKNVSIENGMLVLKLKQKKHWNGTITSIGSEIKTVAKFGYGTYEFVMKASSDASNPTVVGKSVSGSITGAGSFLDLSETEIDVEMEGLPERANLTQTTTWTHEDKPSETYMVVPPATNDLAHQGFHTYVYVWSPGIIKFFRDGRLISTHEHVVPEKPASFLFNHWGTTDRDWGGTATVGVDRYMYIKSFSFTPLE